MFWWFLNFVRKIRPLRILFLLFTFYVFSELQLLPLPTVAEAWVSLTTWGCSIYRIIDEVLFLNYRIHHCIHSLQRFLAVIYGPDSWRFTQWRDYRDNFPLPIVVTEVWAAITSCWCSVYRIIDETLSLGYCVQHCTDTLHRLLAVIYGSDSRHFTRWRDYYDNFPWIINFAAGLRDIITHSSSFSEIFDSVYSLVLPSLLQEMGLYSYITVQLPNQMITYLFGTASSHFYFIYLSVFVVLLVVVTYLKR